MGYLSYGKHYIPRHFNAQDCVGKTFSVPEKYLNKASFGEKCPNGKILSIVRRVGAEDPNDVFFKVYNHVKYPDDPPPEDSDEFCFVKCKQFMSNQVHVRMMVFDRDADNEKAAPRKKREKRSHWQIEVAKPAEFDLPVEVDVHSRRKLRSGRVIHQKIPVPSSSCANNSDDANDNMDESDQDDDNPSIVSTNRSSRGRMHHLPVHREVLRKKIHHSLVKKGIRAKDDEIELSDLSSSNSDESDTDNSV